MRTPAARETIGIEALLVRAYREKKVDRLPPDPRRLLGIRGPAQPGASTMARGDRVDTASWGANAEARNAEILKMLAGAGTALLTAHDLVLSLDDYFVEDHGTADLGFTLWTKAGALDAGYWLGDEHGRAWLQPATVTATHGPEGEGVHVVPTPGTRLRTLTKIVIAPVLVLAGRSAEPPYVSPVEIERMRKIFDPKKRRTVGQEPVYVTPLDVVVRERAIYAAWHDALGSLAAALADAPGYAVAPPCLPARPWEGALGDGAPSGQHLDFLPGRSSPAPVFAAAGG